MSSSKKILIPILIFVLLTGLSACSKDSSEKQAAAGQKTTEEMSVPKPDPNSSAEALTGNWIDINDAERFANVTKADTGYQFEDNEGKYPAAFKDGILEVKISDNDVAVVYLDTKTGHMLSVYNGISCEYKKK